MDVDINRLHGQIGSGVAPRVIRDGLLFGVAGVSALLLSQYAVGRFGGPEALKELLSSSAALPSTAALSALTGAVVGGVRHVGHQRGEFNRAVRSALRKGFSGEGLEGRVSSSFDALVEERNQKIAQIRERPLGDAMLYYQGYGEFGVSAIDALDLNPEREVDAETATRICRRIFGREVRQSLTKPCRADHLYIAVKIKRTHRSLYRLNSGSSKDLLESGRVMRRPFRNLTQEQVKGGISIIYTLQGSSLDPI